MFTKIIEFIRPPPGSRDTLPAAPADRVNPVSRREQQAEREEHSERRPENEVPPNSSPEDVFPTEDAVMVSLDAIRVMILGAPVAPEVETATPAVAAYQRNQKPTAPDMGDVSGEMAEALRMIDVLARAGVAAIPVPKGKDFLSALRDAVRK